MRRELAAGALRRLPRTHGGLPAGGRAHRAAGGAGHALGLPALAVARVLRAVRGLGRSLRSARSALAAGAGLTGAAGVALLRADLVVRRGLGGAGLRGGGVVLWVRGILVGRGRGMCLLWPRCGMLALGVGGR
ncbi:hypothetical protein [Nocardiopsis alborubida]|uniref:Uncharacterized protein n=1 Tax=Nocardiopsis alborubida TaxID=146802 RepID=A0A7X6RQK1_9ACTN|nr:hypothetical protein [Nocardiopsis alborubida]NKY98317.1 hypothetical protein [Nocardiopsis alborubida]